VGRGFLPTNFEAASGRRVCAKQTYARRETSKKRPIFYFKENKIIEESVRCVSVFLSYLFFVFFVTKIRKKELDTYLYEAE